ncbi:hypothetical protein GCM10009133_04640 [Cocleimonas flava]
MAIVPFSSGVRSALRAIFAGMVSADKLLLLTLGINDVNNNETAVIAVKMKMIFFDDLIDRFVIIYTLKTYI